MNTTTSLQGPAWDLSDEYISLSDSRFAADASRLDELLARIEEKSTSIALILSRAPLLDPETESASLTLCKESAILVQEALILAGNLSRYVNCLLSVDASDTAAKECRGALSVKGAALDAASGALELTLARCPEAFLKAFLADPATAALRYGLQRERKRAARLLSLEEEKLLAAMRPDGHTAWGNLYDSITGAMKVEVQIPEGPQTMGLAQAMSLLRGANPAVRKPAFRGINAAFRLQEESCAAILNALAGWRHTEYRQRSRVEPVHFLDPALDANHLKRETLECLMSVVDESAEVGRQALRHQARLLGVPALGPWDLTASAPRLSSLPGFIHEVEDLDESAALPFEEAIALIAEAYGAIEPEMGDFVLEMARTKRIEGRSMPGKRPGAYCTSFPKSRNTRVYMVYQGSMSDVSTLAHELGHAWHGRMVESLPLPETHYPMCLAETASTFGEAIVAQALAQAGLEDPASMLEVEWSNAQDAATFLLNIPARFAFERAFYEARSGKPVGPAGLKDLMRSAWERYYGDSLCEYDEMFWCSKLHFHMTGLSFYNFPYTFGSLFSLGVLARRDAMGEAFPAAYRALLRDTGRMDVEDLALAHLGADLSRPEFWRESIAMIRGRVDHFGGFVDSLMTRKPMVL